MNYSELQEELQKRGVNISIITLRRYVKNGLITEPERKHYGRGKGEHVDFPPKAIIEAAETYQLIKKYKYPPYEMIKTIRLVESLQQNPSQS